MKAQEESMRAQQERLKAQRAERAGGSRFSSFFGRSS